MTFKASQRFGRMLGFGGGAALFLALIGAGATLVVTSSAVHAAANGSGDDSVRGKRLFLRCASCHEIAPSGIKRIGPSLQGVVGRKAGSLPDYSYSAAMKATDFVWDAATLDRWLEKPTSVVPGTAMAFAGLPNPADRQALIAYLQNPDH